MNKKTIHLLAILLSTGIVSAAQEKTDVVSVQVGGGLHSFLYSFDAGTRNMGFGGMFGGTYRYDLSKGWSLLGGVDFSTYQTKATVNTSTSSDENDPVNGYSYVLRTYYNNLKEKQNAIVVGVPVGVAYSYSINDNYSLLFSGGLKLNFPISSKYKTSGSLETRGYYPDLDVELADMPNHGFTTSSISGKDNIKTKGVAFGAFVDGGVSFKLNEQHDLFVGAYCSYAFTDCLTGSSQNLVAEGPTYHGILNSNAVENANLFAAGVKVGISINRKRAARVKEVAPEPVPAEVVKPIQEPTPVVQEPEEPKSEPVAQPVEKKDTVAVAQPVDSMVVLKKEVQSYADSLSIIIHFHVDSFEPIIDPEIDRLLDSVAHMKRKPMVQVLVVGHTCDIGEEDVNYMVGLGRANHLKKELVKRGVNESQITVRSAGSKEPLVPNTSDENRYRNRRVHIIVK